MKRLTALACVLAGWLPRRRKRRGERVTLTIKGDSSDLVKAAERASAAVDRLAREARAVRTGTVYDDVRVFVDGREVFGEPVFGEPVSFEFKKPAPGEYRNDDDGPNYFRGERE